MFGEHYLELPYILACTDSYFYCRKKVIHLSSRTILVHSSTIASMQTILQVALLGDLRRAHLPLNCTGSV